MSPQPRRNGKVQIASRVPDEKERLAITRAVTAKEIAPSSRNQAQSWVNWKELGRRLGQPFDAEQIPYSKLRQMRRDPMISFGLHLIMTTLARAQWRAESEDAQVAAFIDNAWRRVHARYVFQRCTALSFGFSAIVKRFEQDFPKWTYRPPDSTSEDPVPVWNEGSVPAVVWKPFVNIAPEYADPFWDEDTGEFAGITYTGPREDGQEASSDGPDIDVYRSLWGTNERDSVFGSLYGYPRISYAYRYWWSYMFRWAMYDQYFERTAVPPLVVWHPEGVYIDPITNEQLDFADVAYEAGNRARANGIITAPSQLAESGTGGIAGGSAGQRAWDLKYLEGGAPNVDFDDSFAYLDTMKIRSLWIPEQSIAEGRGGTSSRNVASQMQELFIESQVNLMAEIDDEINRFIWPQLLAQNFPEFEGDVRKVTTGFASEDTEFLKATIQYIGAKNPEQLGVDVREGLERFGVPLLSPAEQQRKQLELQQAQLAPALAVPVPGTAGVIDDPASATGFSYIDHPGVIHLSDEDEFATSLPSSIHFSTEATKKQAVKLQKLYRAEFRARVRDLAQKIEEGDISIQLSDAVELAEEDSATTEVAATVISATAAKKAADAIVNAWIWPQERLARLAESTVKVLGSVFRNALDEIGSSSGLTKRPAKEGVEEWTKERAQELVEGTDSSLRDEMRTYLRDALQDGTIEPKDIAKGLRSHFSDRPASKSGTVAIHETVGAWNMGTLLLAKANDVKQVQARDALKGHTDQECEDRNKKLFKVADAIKEDQKRRHPNCVIMGTDIEVLGGISAVSRASWSGEVYEIVTAMGNRLTVTPNHPVLTQKGWVSASLINPGDNVISRVIGDFSLNPSMVESYGNNIPPLVEDIFQSFVPNSFLSFAIASPSDFYGDGKFFESKIDIVESNRLLGLVDNIALIKHRGKISLVDTSEPSLLLKSLSPFDLCRLGSLSTSNSSMRWLSDLFISPSRSDSYFSFCKPFDKGIVSNASTVLDMNKRLAIDVPSRNLVPIGVMGSSNAQHNSFVSEPFTHSSMSNAILDSEFSNAFATAVALDRITEVNFISSWHGTVYDLQTDSKTYFANGILTHNCTLEFRLLDPEVQLSIQESNDMPPHQLAYYDPNEQTVWFSEDATIPERNRYMDALGRCIQARA